MTKNADLIASTAEALLKQITASATNETEVNRLKSLAEAFALVASNDPKSGGRAVVM